MVFLCYDILQHLGCYCICSLLTMIAIQLGKLLEGRSCLMSSHVKLRHFSLLSLRNKVILHTSFIAKFGKHKLHFSVCQYCFTEVPVIVHRELPLLNKLIWKLSFSYQKKKKKA